MSFKEDNLISSSLPSIMLSLPFKSEQSETISEHCHLNYTYGCVFESGFLILLDHSTISSSLPKSLHVPNDVMFAYYTALNNSLLQIHDSHSVKRNLLNQANTELLAINGISWDNIDTVTSTLSLPLIDISGLLDILLLEFSLDLPSINLTSDAILNLNTGNELHFRKGSVYNVSSLVVPTGGSIEFSECQSTGIVVSSLIINGDSLSFSNLTGNIKILGMSLNGGPMVFSDFVQPFNLDFLDVIGSHSVFNCLELITVKTIVSIVESNQGDGSLGEINSGQSTLPVSNLGDGSLGEIHSGQSTLPMSNLGDGSLGEIHGGQSTLPVSNLGDGSLGENNCWIPDLTEHGDVEANPGPYCQPKKRRSSVESTPPSKTVRRSSSSIVPTKVVSSVKIMRPVIKTKSYTMSSDQRVSKRQWKKQQKALNRQICVENTMLNHDNRKILQKKDLKQHMIKKVQPSRSGFKPESLIKLKSKSINQNLPMVMCIDLETYQDGHFYQNQVNQFLPPDQIIDKIRKDDLNLLKRKNDEEFGLMSGFQIKKCF
ncbi:hypothetical protein P9112_003203 [Eukaryota sp. TZLM1-RC]